jgi:predicted adenine nucleotide alpha hydrolase (AANH) superfamily ATPase
MNQILLHCCCGPCATYTVNRLREEEFEVTAFWYNPNIHPFTEHQSRLEAMRTLAKSMELPLIVAEGYDMIDYFRAVTEHEGERCGDCFQLRLSKTAEVACSKGFTYFTTTLLISPYQKHELLRAVGETVAKEQGVTFYYEDFRSGFRDSHQLSRELNLYHQKYCGCVYSEWERYGKVDIARILGGDEK